MPPASLRTPPGLRVALAANFVWINASEIFRYFVFVMPGMRAGLPELPGVAPMSLATFLSWGLWDALLILVVTGFCWLFLERFGERFGRDWRIGVLAGTLVWAAVFGLLWLALFNMALAPPAVLAAALPLSWLELAVAGAITAWAMRGGRARQSPG